MSHGLIGKLARIGALPSDTPEEALRKQTLVLAAALLATVAIGWVVTYALLGLYLSAAIPFAYQVVSVLNLALFAKTKRYRSFRAFQLGLSLALPFFLQISLGGFVPSSGVVLWSFTAPLGALLFSGRRQAMGWLVAFVAVVALEGAIDPFLTGPAVPRWFVVLFFVGNTVGVTGTCYFLLHYFVRERDAAAANLASERARSEKLLLNVLPEPIAARLKSGETTIADGLREVGVLFADLAGFTPMSAKMTPDEIVRMLDDIFTAFDHLAAERGLEKIKTIGDAYMVASGLLDPDPLHVEKLADMALAMQEVVAQRDPLSLRIGLDIGPVVAGVIGQTKFAYDLWGDTVNTASRMESHGIPGAIQTTERVHVHLRETFAFEDRGAIEVKGKGEMRVFLLRKRAGADRTA